MVSRRPFWPPWPPSNLSRAVPGRQVQLVVRQQRFFRLDLPVAQRGGDRLAAEVHEGGRLQQPDRLPGDLDLGGLAEQLAIPARSARPALSASASTNQNPALCRVRACSGPGLPSPTMRRKPAMTDATAARRAGAPGQARRQRLTSSLRPSWRPWPPALRPRPALRPASSTSSLPCLAMTTATSCSLPSFSSGISTPVGSLSSDRWTMSPTARLDQVDLDELRQVLRQAADVRLR